MITFGSLFAGIGGFDLGFERAGMQCRWQCEIDPFCQKVLAKHWPDVGRWDDVRTFPPPPAEDWSVDVVCGGFPCQDISNAGKRAGINGERSGLWSEFARVIHILRPRIVVVENVPALLSCDGGRLGRVLSDLADAGMDAEWDVLSAEEFGAPHIRERVFIVANSDSFGHEGTVFAPNSRAPTNGIESRRETAGRVVSTVAADSEFMQSGKRCHAYKERRRKKTPQQAGLGASRISEFNGGWNGESPLLRMDDGVPDWMDRLRGIGNSVVPQVAEWIGRRIVEQLSEK